MLKSLYCSRSCDRHISLKQAPRRNRRLIKSPSPRVMLPPSHAIDARQAGSYLQKVLSRWQTKDKIVSLTMLAQCLSNMDKIIMSVAIIPMSVEYNWSPSVSGFIQSSFFIGYCLMQIPGGALASISGGRRVLPYGLGTWSLSTLLAPLAASVSLPALGLSRVCVGLGESCAPSSIMDMLSRVVKKEERGAAVSLAFTGLHVGSVVGLTAAPWIIDTWGWRAVFISFGGLGFIWLAAWETLMAEISLDDPANYAKLTASSDASKGNKVPYRAFFRSRCVLALSLTHFANNFFHYVLLAWLPSYTMSELGSVTNLHDASLASLLPPLAGIGFSMAAGPLSELLISSGATLPQARKIMQSAAFACPALLLSAIVLGDFDDPGSKMVLITLALGISSLSLGGLFCTHSDMSPKYSGALLGITNCAGALSGVIGVSLVGWLLDRTGSFDIALFAPCILLHLIGIVAFDLFCVNEEVDFDAEDNSPFAFEAYLQGPKQAVSSLISQGATLLKEILPHPTADALDAAKAARTNLSSMSMGEVVPEYLRTRREMSPSKPVLVSYWTVGAAFADDFNASSSSEEEEELTKAEDIVAKLIEEKKE